MAEETPAPAPATALVRAPRVVQWIDVPEYDGYQARVWLNVTRRCLEDVNSGDQARALVALQEIVLEHNGWADPDGEAYPAADAPEFWTSLPVHLIGAVVRGVRAGAVSSKNSPGPKGP